ncbi:hypothetical protein CAPTEDRAFT_179209 [Capitella teleta]|uniref:RING-type domain-containing protein n=1 Tax=Capitella teleta TaxID=283909 RepID=R7TZF0_CAPTE|nr:hypothetical protein CAPTEDRAFT_179209 [Capitella teleta]|eukprot:ELT99017.1 hypothetical protein CAPTEDRAFT_179209 [Capitella teleta]
MLPKPSRDTAIKAVGVILRVPALFIAEAWYRTDPEAAAESYSKQFRSPEPLDRPHQVFVRALYYATVLFALALMALPLKKLVNFYMYIISAGLFALCHYISWKFVESEESSSICLEDSSCIERIGMNLVAQGILCATIGYLIKLKGPSRLFLIVYTLPLMARIIQVQDLQKLHNTASVLSMLSVVAFIFNHVPVVLDLVKSAGQKMALAVQMYGWLPFFLALWMRLLLPVQFLLFWLSLFALQLYRYSHHAVYSEGWVVLVLASTGECCVTPVSLLGLCVTVAYASHVILLLTKIYLQGREALEADSVMHRGWTEGFTMFLLAVQTGMIELKAAQRAFLMSIVLFIVLSSLIQSMYEITDPILLSLGASQHRSICRHLRTILLCTFLWMFPIFMTFTICQFFDLDFWLLVVISSCILTSLQVLGSLAVYTLFIYDTLRSNPWESLDDVVYYVRATTRVLEFIVAVYVVLYGVKESIFGDWSWVNSSILLVHCYFNVWQRLQAGWKSYLMRREAVKKVEGLPEATSKQLGEHEDICAICYQEMKTARITPCQHFYHGLCLRKWLYVQDHCPMCHQKISLVTQAEASGDAS